MLRNKLLLLSIVSFILLCLPLVPLTKAASMWSQTYSAADGAWACAMVSTFDGGYVIAGYTYVSAVDWINFWLIKTDSLGNIQWSRTYGGAGNDMAYSLVATSDGGYALAGVTMSFGAGQYDFWLVKTDASGNVQWNQTYGGTDWDYGFALVATSDGGYALAGSTDSFGAGSYDFWIVKTDALGNMEWNQTYGETGYDWAYSLIATSDGGYALAGGTYSFGAGRGDIWLVKTDSAGNMQWNETYGGANTDFAYSMVEASDGGYVLAGEWNCTDPADNWLENLHLDGDSWLVKTDALGAMQWDHTYGGAASEWACSVVATSDGGYAVGGTWNCTGYGLEIVYAATVFDGDCWLIKTDENGVVAEYSSLLVPALVLTATAFVIINKKRLLRKRSEKP